MKIITFESATQSELSSARNKACFFAATIAHLDDAAYFEAFDNFDAKLLEDMSLDRFRALVRSGASIYEVSQAAMSL
jgi:hypothetical protein